MTPVASPARKIASIAILVTGLLGGSVAGQAQTPPANSAAAGLMQQMAGTWSVQQRMWQGPDAEATQLPPAVAHRRLVATAFLEEVMEPASKNAKEAFVRVAYFDYNGVTEQYEYFSLDTRAPQMMNERSEKAVPDRAAGWESMNLKGGSFVAPEWGRARNVAFTYRLTVGEIKQGRQVVQLYLTPQAAESPKEFLAFEYVYTRQR